MTEGKILYTFVLQAESKKGSLVKQHYSAEEVEEFKKQAENLYYYTWESGCGKVKGRNYAMDFL